MRAFLDEINISMVRLGKEGYPPQYGWSWMSQKGKVRRKNSLSLHDSLSAGTSVFSCLQIQTENGSYCISSLWAFRAELAPSALLVLRPRDSAFHFPGSSSHQQQILIRLSLHNHVSQFLTVSFWYISTPLPADWEGERERYWQLVPLLVRTQTTPLSTLFALLYYLLPTKID